MYKNNSTKTKELRQFGIIVGIGFPLILGWLLPILTGHLFREWTLWIGIPLLLVSFVQPNILFYPYKLWMKIGYLLGWINSRIILGLVFIVILQPIALIMKFLKHDPLRKNFNNKITYRELKKDSVTNLKKIF